MTILPSLNDRKSLNIDTFQKAFTWSALALHNVCRLSSDKDNKDLIKYSHKLNPRSVNESKAVLFLEVKLPYNSDLFVINGGNLHLAIQEVSQFSVTLPLPFLASATPNLPNEPSWVNNLEKYCLWTAHELTNNSLTAADSSFDLGVVDIPGKQAYVQISATMPLVVDVLFSERSYVDALSVSIVNNPQGIGNSSILGNTSTLGN